MAEGGSALGSQPWHSDSKLTVNLKNFHDKYANYPKQEIDKAKSTHTRNLNIIKEKLREKDKGLCSRIEYTGSAYEGVKIKTDIEFDCMLIINGGKDLQTDMTKPPRPGFVRLKPVPGKQESEIIKPYLDTGYISAEKLVSKFMGFLQKIVNEDPTLKQTIKLRKHGPAIQMDVNKIGSSTFWFSVDMVPAYEVKSPAGLRSLYVSKPFNIDSSGDDSGSGSLAWRLSTSLEEKSTLDGIDRDNGCRKMCLRILKAMRNRDATMKALTSFHFKTALLHINKRQHSWKQNELGQRMVDLMTWLATKIEGGNMPNFFNPQMNIIFNIPEITKKNISERFKKLLRSEIAFNKLIDAPASKSEL